MNTNNPEKDKTVLMLEAVRYAELNRADLSDDEYGMMIRSIWELLNPAHIAGRKSAINTVIEKKDGSRVRFTAHSHECEALKASYDDILVYRSLDDGLCPQAHYIIDRFCPKKII